MRKVTLLLLVSLLVLSGCLERAKLPPQADFGPNPTLPEPNPGVLPTVNVSRATGWSGDAGPTPAEGLEVRALARALDHPRWLYVLPNGDVLVAETNAPPRPEEGKGARGKVMKMLMKKAGSAVPSADRITLLRDADGDGILEVRAPFLTGLHSPGRPRRCSRDSWSRTARRAAALWGWPWTARVRCWWPTTWGTRCGA
jgi:glucose/arabinose dehydrogenase